MQRTILILCMATLLCVTALAAPVAAATTTETFQADADTAIRSTSGGTNYGTSTSISIRQTADGTLDRTLIRFDLSSLPEGATIESATLYGYMSSRMGDREVAAYRVTGVWNESGVTWDNAPSNATQPTSMTDPDPTANVWVGWNVTQDVQACVQGTPNYGWLLVFPDESIPTTEQRVQLRSRNYSAPALRPYLNVTYSTAGAAPVLTSIEVSPATANLAAGATQQFTATAKDQDNNEMSGVTFTWTSDNETVGTVNATGFFTAFTAGTTTITAAAEGVTGTAEITGTPAAQIDLTIAGVVNPTPGTAVFAREPNRVQIRSIQNTGTDTATNIVVALYASDVANGTVAVNSTTLESLAGGAQIAITTIVDPTIRNLQGGKVRYTAIVDPDNLIAETDETNNVKVGFADKDILYNGYKGKTYWEGGSNVTTVRTYDLRGDIIHSFGDSQYVSGSFGDEGWTNYTVTWTSDNLPLPAGATIHDAWLYVPYCWDNTNSAPGNVSIDFNGVRVSYANWYHDVSNFGAYRDHVYGLMTYNVTDLFEAGVNNTALFTREGADAKISPAGFTLAVIYEDTSAARKQIFVNEEFDVLGADEGNYGTSMEEATAYVPFSGMIIDTASVARANLTTFVPWGNDGEGNLFFNGEQVGTGVWNYGPRAVGASDNPQVAVDDREVTAYLNATGNEAAVQGDNTWKSPCMVAAQTFLVVEYADELTAPVAGFTANVTAGEAPLAVQFNDTSTGLPTSRFWDFEDDGIVDSNDRNPVHTYTTAGTYTVNLTVTSAAGSDSEVKTGHITVSDAGPAAQVDLAIAGTVNPIPAGAVFAREPNPVRIMNVKNNGPDAAANIRVALYASDVANGTVAINSTTINTLASGTQTTVTLIDPTIRNLDGGTVIYTAVLDPDNLIAETNEANNNKASIAKPVRYNGYKGKGIYWDGGSNITTQQTYDLSGDVVFSTQPESAYKAVGWTDRTETWTASDLPVPTGATIEKVLLYFSYNWDQTEGGFPNLVATFNGNSISLGTPYRDWSNFGAYADYEYGLFPAVDVTSLFVRDGDNTLVTTPNAGNKNALYPSTLVVVYSDPSATRKQIFINEECDVLGYSENSYGTTVEEATAYVPFSGMALDLDIVRNATLYSFAGNAGPDEGNLIFNGEMVKTDAWQGTAWSASAQAFNVTDLLRETGNEAAVQGTDSGGMVAIQQILVVEYADGTDAPVADFTANVTSGEAPLSVTFTDASANTPTAWSWESRSSGTGESWTEFSTNQSATHSFEAGAYDIRLTATNADGSDTVTKTQYISSSAGAKRLATVQSGTISGDLYVGAYGEFNSGTSYTTNMFNRTFTLPAYTDIQWARLYTVVYAAGTDNRTGTATVGFDGNGNGTYDTLGIETLATAGDSTANVYPVNDHVNRQYSDYLLWYDVTDLVDSQNPKAEVVSTPVASNFDGRIKELVLVVAYSDGDGDEVHYWVNDGHDWQANGAGGVTSTFATGGLASGWTDAVLRNVMLSSYDATYTFNGAAYTGANSTISFGTNTWDVRNNLTAGSDGSFTYVPNGGSYKTTLATLAVKYPASGGDAPDLAVSTLASNNGEVFSASGNTYTATITNIGTGNADAFAAGFNVSGVTGTVAVESLAAGANTTVAWTDETVRSAGDTVTVTVVADPDGLIGEANEGNNLRSIERTVVHNGYRGTRWTDGEDIATAATYDVRGDLRWSAGDGAYLSASGNWIDYTVQWTADDLAVPENAAIASARLYVPYTYDKGPVFPEDVTLTFNGEAVEQDAFHEDEKMWGTSYPYGMTVYDVTDLFSSEGNTALLANTFPGGGNVSVRGMLLAVVYDDGVTAPHTIIMNEGFDLLYGGEAQGTTPEQATTYAPFGGVDTTGVRNATLITVAPGAGPTEGELIFNDQIRTNVWNYAGTSQIGVDERDVTALLLPGENLAAFQSSADYMEAAAAFLVIEYAPEPGSILVTSDPAGAAVWLDGEDTDLVTPITLPNVPTGDHVVTLKLNGYADASVPVTVEEGETMTVDLALTTLTGSLEVTSSPAGAAIFIDGADTGEVTNATLDGIAVGTHTVTLRKDGYADTAAEVTVAYGETATLHRDLARARGSIAVASMPTDAAIWLDGEYTGRTTNSLLENVAAGEHVVTVKKAGYADASMTVTVADNETAVAHFTLIEPAGSIVVTSAPDGARIFLDAAETGEVTDAHLANVPVGTHTVRVELDGYLDTEETVTVVSGAIASVHFDLARASIALRPGWNFVSTPKRLAAGQDTIAIFDGVETDGRPVLLYNGTGQWEAMSREEAFQPLDGVWIYANGTYEIPLAFAAASNIPPPTKDLDAGWNAIGFTDTVPAPAAITLRTIEPAWATLFGWKAGEQAYDVSIIRGDTGRYSEMRKISPFQGYWLYMNDADTLTAIGA